ncbi:demethylmacrocin O-methyltransferase [Ferrovum myxofaciens]|uniref:Demethylmacrocin O-methyltransferase n=1 Tax=Ferrovum myxofaciens TaxID=416213 RepID=A0A149VYT9_9PROT|nr:class I SAM-dependent methyltransferase [Ferrovum myxofaciens]KXW58064.1 demethylmacrocin O-methyltransferase [Ferrovum myxofaciens]
MNKNSLYKLYMNHVGKVTDKWSLYLQEYDRLFESFRDKPVRLLEIGIQNGGSLEIWSSYFNNAVSLLGCDINSDCDSLTYDDSRITVFVGDANSPDTFERIIGKVQNFDLIIDDGSHKSSDIIKSFTLYFPYLKEGGMFIIEDIHCSYWSQFEGGLFDPYSSMSFFKRLTDIINHEHWGITRTSSDILHGIFTKYDCHMDEDVLSQLHSIEFVNSMCIIRKAPSVENVLGIRFVRGTEANVISSILDFNSARYQPDPALEQYENHWTKRTVPPEETIEQIELSLTEALNKNEDLEKKIKFLEQKSKEEIESFIGSRSWKITAPLRAMNSIFNNLPKSVLYALKNACNRLIK